LVELEVPLRIPPNFGPAFPANGINPATGLYDPDPQFWTGGFNKNGGGATGQNDPPGSAGLFQILPNGTTLVTPTNITQIVTATSAKPINVRSNGMVEIDVHSSPMFNPATV